MTFPCDWLLTLSLPAIAAKLLVDGTRTDGGLALVELRSRFIVAHSLIATAVTVPSNAAAA
jgi:hypothetical protein